ncbi:THO complex subunit 5 B [Phytophthora cinnamomi]|uniref:THO complex subunit 5 B n=1 Tax=Phytophthora cinnamomi TaxID=4785 RepID=UPI00355ACAA5|nr:THO complex subunit 5 B [Phytophthora cinnamomi]
MSVPPNLESANRALDTECSALVAIDGGSANSSSAAQHVSNDFAGFQDVDLLSELLLSEEDDIELPTLPVKRGRTAESKARQRVQQATSARRRRQCQKIEMDMLREEQRYLSEYLESLLDKHEGVCSGFFISTWKEAAKAELHKLKVAEVINDKLRQEIYRHNGLVRSYALYPLKKTTAVTRSTVGALLVRTERCDDGIDRVVCRYICTKIHRMHSAELPPDIKRFSRSSQLGAKVADSMVYEAIKGIASLNTL